MKHYSLPTQKIGHAPGQIVYTKAQIQDHVLHLIQYKGDFYREENSLSNDNLFSVPQNPQNNWIQFYGQNIEKLEAIGKTFGIHKLTLEDIANVTQSSKLEVFEHYTLITVPEVNISDTNTNTYEMHQLSLVITQNCLISFHETQNPSFIPLLERLKYPNGQLHKNNVHYLAYTILDILIDQYFLVIEDIGKQCEQIEGQMVLEHNQKLLNQLYGLRNNILFLRKSILPVNEVIKGFEIQMNQYIGQETLSYIRDLSDHLLQVLDELHVYNEMVTNLFDLYFSISSEKTNRTMKTLTSLSIIFMPLTLITGLYGMNFKYMPELDSPLGYPLVLLGMLLLSIIIIWILKKKHWL